MKDPKALRKAIMTAKSLASLVDPKFSRVPLPDIGTPAPEVYVPEHSPAMHEAFGVPMPKGYAGGGEVEDQNPFTQPNDLGFYSHAAATAAELPQERGTPEQFRGMLLNKGVKPAELEWSGFDPAFADQPQVTRQQIAEHFHANRPPVQEKRFQEGATEAERKALQRKHLDEISGYQQKARENPEYDKDKSIWERMQYWHQAEKRELGSKYDKPHHEMYTIPGGENYREILLKHGGEEGFKGIPVHFKGEPNVLTSLMVKDRQDAEGDKVLHLDELQSDWAQKGRQMGFDEPQDQREIYTIRYPDGSTEYGVRGLEEAKRAAEEGGGEYELSMTKPAKGIDRAPYVTKTEDWVDLGLKRALREAAEGGHDKLAWSPGQKIAERYDLSKHVGEIRHEKNDDGTYNLDIYDPKGDRVFDKEDMTADEVEQHLGKDMASKIFAGHGEPDESPGYRDWRTLSGLDLQMGAKWPFEMYDRMIPKRLLKLAKQHDPEAKLEKSVINHPSYHEYEDGSREEGSDAYEGPTTLHAIRITPKMRESILKKGFPAYAQGGEVEAYADGGEIDPELFKQYMKRIHSPLSEDPESVRKALQISGSYRAPVGMETGVGSLYNIKQSVPAKDVKATIGDIPGITMKKPVKKSWEDFYEKGKGGVFINMGGDLSNFGRLTHINDKELAWPVDLHAGTKFMLEPNPKYVWGNAAGHSTAFENKIRAAEEAGKDVYGIFSPMGPSAVNSSHNMFDALMAQIPNAGISKKHMREFDAALKRGDHLEASIKSNPKKLKAHLDALKAWPGLENAKEASEFARPEAGNLTGTHRTMIVKFMDKADWLKKGFPEVGVTRAAITDPELKGVGGNKIGHRIVKLSSRELPGAKRAFEHSTYPTYTGGEYEMDVPLVQRHYAAPDVIEEMIKKPTKAGQIVHPYSEDTLGRATARKLFEEQKQMQPINQRFLDSVMMGMENQSKYGFKKGGSVRKALMIAKTTKKK